MNSRKTSKISLSIGKFLSLDSARSAGNTKSASSLQSPHPVSTLVFSNCLPSRLNPSPTPSSLFCCTLSVRIEVYNCLRSNERDGTASSVLEREQRRLGADRQSFAYKYVKTFPIDSESTRGKTTSRTRA